MVLSRLQKLVFRIRHQAPAARFTDSLLRVGRLARLMTVSSTSLAGKCSDPGASRIAPSSAVPRQTATRADVTHPGRSRDSGK
jgi:hypothetical protein